ncbi:hypothetical protein NXG04_07775 [Klebsiella pneumoniae]|nr:hypothetical protein [Klebsiella pneumoniae]MDS7714453.1 hypothetical protein [Klebsiella pneumoniae]
MTVGNKDRNNGLKSNEVITMFKRRKTRKGDGFWKSFADMMALDLLVEGLFAIFKLIFKIFD